jgi:glucose-1-phosphate cytidylyltransferase
VKAILLAGGLGTRLREETEFRPKPMVEVGGRPILWHIMKNLSHFGITEFIIATGYKSSVIKDYFLNYEAQSNDFTVQLGQRDKLEFHGNHGEADWKVTVAFTGDDTMTGGRVLSASKYLGSDEPFFVTYGDGLADVDIDALRESHQRSGKTGTITCVQPTSRFGVMDVSPSGQVTQFREKPRMDGWINIGFMILETRSLELFSSNCVLEQGPLVELARRGELNAFQHSGFWQPMDTFRESKLLNDYWDSGEAPWKKW